MAPCPDAEVTALAPQNKSPSTLSVGSPVTEIIRRNNQYMYSFSKDTLHCPKMEINDKKWTSSNSTCALSDAKNAKNNVQLH